MSGLNGISEKIIPTDFHVIFNNLPGNHLLIKADPPQFTMLAATDRYIEMIGRPLDALIGIGVFEAFPSNPDKPEDKSSEKLLASFNEVIKTRKENYIPVQQYDLSDFGKSNFLEKFWQIKNTPVLSKNGEVEYIINSVDDITEKILSLRKDELLRPLQQSHNLYLQAPLAIHINKGPELIISLANDLALKMWGRGKEVIGMPLLKALPELEGAGYEIMMNEVIDTGIAKSFYEQPVELLRDGILETFWFTFIYQPYFEDGSEKPVGVLVFADEVTEQVKAKRLVKHNIELEAKNKELERFAYIASHDLQEPLRKVAFFIHMLRTNAGKLDDQSEFYMGKIVSSTNRMSDLIRDILDFSKLSDSNLEYSKVNLNRLLKDVISDFEVSLQSKNATIEVEHLPVIQAVPLHIQQIFHNLISNALKFIMPDSKPVITIKSQKVLSKDVRVSYPDLLPDTDYYHITVEDNGIGFAQEYAEQIFEIFQRLHGKLEYQGTGIGLALCKKIIENHRGKIWATSVVNSGSTFHIMLPAQAYSINR